MPVYEFECSDGHITEEVVKDGNPKHQMFQMQQKSKENYLTMLL